MRQRLLGTESRGAQDVEHVLDGKQCFRVLDGSSAQEGEHVGMCVRDLPIDQELSAQALLPVEDGGRTLHLGDDGLDDGIDKRILAREVVIQRHRLDAELAPEPAHTEPFEPVSIDEADCGPDDLLAVERDSSLRTHA